MIRSLAHATDILWSFQRPGEALRLRDIMDRTGFHKGKCFRLLHSLHVLGFLDRTEKRYMLATEAPRRRRYHIGYASPGDLAFFAEVERSVVAAAAERGVLLTSVNNRLKPEIARRNARSLVTQRLDLVIEFQLDEALGPELASIYRKAEVPVVAVDVPIPGAHYFGADNYHAGLLAGRHLARWAVSQWHGKVDEVLVFDMPRVGAVPGARMRGALEGMKQVTRSAASWPVVTLPCPGMFEPALKKVRRHLRTSAAHRILVAAPNDPIGLGAARAFQEAGRDSSCAIVGHNGEPDARAELRERRTPFVATVAFFPERYGAGLIKLALDILSRHRPPSAVFMKHQIITPQNVDHLYPNDALGDARGYATF